MVRKMDPHKRELWDERIRRFHAVKQTVKMFCENEGVSKAAFYLWKKRLASKATAKPAEKKFQPVQIAVANPLATIRLPEGVVVELANSVQSVELLKQLLARGGGSC